jgi:hypothetical protein
MHARLGQGRRVVEVRLIAEHCCSGVNEPGPPCLNCKQIVIRRTAAKKRALE